MVRRMNLFQEFNEFKVLLLPMLKVSLAHHTVCYPPSWTGLKVAWQLLIYRNYNSYYSIKTKTVEIGFCVVIFSAGGWVQHILSGLRLKNFSPVTTEQTFPHRLIGGLLLCFWLRIPCHAKITPQWRLSNLDLGVTEMLFCCVVKIT